MSANFETRLSEHDLRCTIALLAVAREYIATAYATVRDDEWLAGKCRTAGLACGDTSEGCSNRLREKINESQ